MKSNLIFALFWGGSVALALQRIMSLSEEGTLVTLTMGSAVAFLLQRRMGRPTSR